MMSDTTEEKITESYKLDAWERHENIAMHFNDLILKVRIQALGALAAIVTVGGVLLKPEAPSNQIPWGIITAISAALLAFWVAIWVLDFRYYNRLLMGAVDALLKLETEINSGSKISIEMSTKIEAAVLGRNLSHLEQGTLTGPFMFYAIVLVVLLSVFLYSGYRLWCMP